MTTREHPSAGVPPRGAAWLDSPDAEPGIEQRLERGELTREEAGLLRDWRRDGFVILPGAIDADLVGRITEAVDAAWETKDPRARISKVGIVQPVDPALRVPGTAMLDIYMHCDAALDAIFAPPVSRFLQIVFEGPALAFQSLSFEFGTEQAMHQDTAYVVVDPPRHLVATWIALQDLSPGSGELEYYVGSHRIPDFDFGGRLHYDPSQDEHALHLAYLDALHERSQAMELERRQFTAKRGDVLIWSAQLVHGGSPITDSSARRRSLVTHYCAIDAVPKYFVDIPQKSGMYRHSSGCFFSSAHLERTGAP